MPRAESPGSADPENDLLPNAGPLVAPVEAGRQVPVFVLVLRDVRVEQEQPDAADVDLPHPGENLTGPRVDRDDDRIAIAIEGREDGQVRLASTLE